MTIVVDASVAVKFAVEEEGTDRALRVLSEEPDLVAPDLLLIETANAFWSLVRESKLLEPHAADNLAAMPSFFTRLWPSAALAADALELGFRLRHPLYDCFYLALAQRLGVTLLTADKKFAAKVRASPWSHMIRML